MPVAQISRAPRAANRDAMTDELRSFLAALGRTPSADNSQPWTFSIRGQALHCEGQPGAVDGPQAVMTAHSQLMTGGAMHEAMSAQLPDAAIRGTVQSGQSGAWSLSVELAAVSKHWRKASHDALLQRHTNRLAYRPDPVLWRPEAFGLDEDIQLHLIEPGEEHRLIARAVEQSAQARFQCRELHEWLHGSLRWTEAEVERGDGLDIRTLGLPYPARALLHFLAPWSRQRRLNALGLYKVLAANEAAGIRHAPALLAITGPSHSSAVYSAGRAMLNAWTSLNAAGYAVHPYYVITDMTNRLRAHRLDADLAGLVQGSDATLRGALPRMQADHQLHMLLRIGRPVADVARSIRKPADPSLLARLGPPTTH